MLSLCNRTHAVFGNGVESSWSFDPQMVRLQSATTTLPSQDRVQDLIYRHDPVGDLNKMDSLLPEPGPGSELPGGGTWRFFYDGVDRLVTATGGNALAPNVRKARADVGLETALGPEPTGTDYDEAVTGVGDPSRNRVVMQRFYALKNLAEFRLRYEEARQKKTEGLSP